MDIAVNISGVRIETGRLVLREWYESDLDDFYEYASTEGVGEAAGWLHHGSREYSRLILQAFIRDGDVFAIALKESGKVIGSLGLHRSWANDEDDYSPFLSKEIGYVLSKDYWGRGFMPEAVSAVIGYCFDTLGAEMLTCGHFIENIRSKRVIEKCGFVFLKQSVYYSKQLEKSFDDMRYIMMNKKNTL